MSVYLRRRYFHGPFAGQTREHPAGNEDAHMRPMFANHDCPTLEYGSADTWPHDQPRYIPDGTADGAVVMVWRTPDDDEPGPVVGVREPAWSPEVAHCKHWALGAGRCHRCGEANWRGLPGEDGVGDEVMARFELRRLVCPAV